MRWIWGLLLIGAVACGAEGESVETEPEVAATLATVPVEPQSTTVPAIATSTDPPPTTTTAPSTTTQPETVFAGLSDSQQLVVDRVCSEAHQDGIVGQTSFTWVTDGSSGVAELEEAFATVGYDPGALAETAIPICEEVGWEG